MLNVKLTSETLNEKKIVEFFFWSRFFPLSPGKDDSHLISPFLKVKRQEHVLDRILLTKFQSVEFYSAMKLTNKISDVTDFRNSDWLIPG